MRSYDQELHQNTSGKPTTVCINLHELYTFYKHLLETIPNVRHQLNRKAYTFKMVKTIENKRTYKIAKI